MTTRTKSFTLVLLGTFGLADATAQDDNVPPQITGVAWIRIPNLGGDPIFGPFGPEEPFDPAVDRAAEYDWLFADVSVFDPDFTDEEGNPGNDQVYIQALYWWWPVGGYFAPEPPPITTAQEVFCCDPGFAPASGDTVVIRLLIIIPEFDGKNQARLRGLIDYDVSWLAEFAVANETDPELAFLWQEFFYALENPALPPPNPQAFADAGPDHVVEAGATVELDGSRTFDSFNIGFDPRSRHVFEKDNITYAWEFISGPEAVPPVARDPSRPAVAEVTLNELGTYVYRLTVDDGVNALPTSDSVTVQVVSTIPGNRAPVARATGPSTPLVVGGIITLDGTGSFDPDADPLGYRWQQTNELGEPLPFEQAAESFQPLSGVESPIVTWQSIEPGTFYFRLLVSDGQFVSSARLAVTVIAAEAAGLFIQGPQALNGPGSNVPPVLDGSAGEEPAQNQTGPVFVPSACGPGAVVPLMVVTPVLLMARRARRR